MSKKQLNNDNDDHTNTKRSKGIMMSNEQHLQQQQQQQQHTHYVYDDNYDDDGDDEIELIAQQHQQHQHHQQQYNSPTFVRLPQQPTEGPIEESYIQHQQQQQHVVDHIRRSADVEFNNIPLMIPNNNNNNMLSPKRTHKRSNSHGPSLLRTSGNMMQSPPIIVSPQPMMPTLHSPPNRQIVSPSMSRNSYRTWSPSRVRKSKSGTTMEQITSQLPNMMISSNIAAGGGAVTTTSPKDLHVISPALSPRGGEHRRTISWEAPIEGESLEALNQLIKEKKDALLHRERELLQQQRMLSESLKYAGDMPVGVMPNPPITSLKSKHNRSKSDTNTIVKLNQMKKQNEQPGYNSTSSEQQYQQYLLPMAVKSPKTNLTPNESRSPRPHSTPRPISKEYNEYHKQQQQQQQQQQSQLYPHVTTTTTTTTTSTTSPLTAYSRRKSVDPYQFASLNSASHLNSRTPIGGSGGASFNKPTLSNQYFNNLMQMDLHELEEEIDKEIQQVILQTKSIEGKVEMLERVRCTAPDPLLMLFGENCRPPNVQKTNKSKQSTSMSPSTLSPANNPNTFVTSPSLVHYPSNSSSSATFTNIPYEPTTTTSHNKPIHHHHPSTRGPDRSKSKNLSSAIPRSSAFSPPPRP
ncbi:hypothetical protein SAMD00019534_100380 [Acytostelium subglobosum LB1]|uniref:hypothetical protein n=1 Tax=Acytostelium subglobosum LB1 TaxID=1410327 RepID=UPI000644FEB7|nr:hypothetical protein SAMD00019534_100380 [Acytostelium subglobosum LB1]GAM26863.1 hypothetical protein SAMD00019534_100380 [Acytostelium subglobosum LB1]|eukprot:XP_012750131.1 hypothetical protein SAMD00019534_100380 [Acytostelium subglobosum LB1]